MNGTIQVSTVSTSCRLVNLILDLVIFRILLFPIWFLAGYLGARLGIFGEGSLILFTDPFVDFALTLGSLAVYYFVFETLFQTTPGKLITGTRVLSWDGSKPSGAAIALRTLARFMPFEPFSFLSNTVYGWHDRWSRTAVVRIRIVPEQSCLTSSNQAPANRNLAAAFALAGSEDSLDPVRQDTGRRTVTTQAPANRNLAAAFALAGDEDSLEPVRQNTGRRTVETQAPVPAEPQVEFVLEPFVRTSPHKSQWAEWVTLCIVSVLLGMIVTARVLPYTRSQSTALASYRPATVESPVTAESVPTVQAICFSQEKRSSIVVDNAVYYEGDCIDGFLIKVIKPTSVTFVKEARVWSVNVK